MKKSKNTQRKWGGSKIEITIFIVGLLSLTGLAGFYFEVEKYLFHFLFQYYPNAYFYLTHHYSRQTSGVVCLVGAWVTSLLFFSIGIWKRYSLSKRNELLSRLGMIGCVMTGFIFVFPIFLTLTGMIYDFLIK